ncbi:MAG: hypothetical protein NC177_11835 [Ruminococcus flavefaciens]|nr:hypothetical protein [Ruminococcus flavefaciens]
MYADILKNIVNNYERYRNIAVNLKWTDFNSRYYDWYKKYPVGIYGVICEFPEGYVKNKFEQAYVQTVLTKMSYSEEFDKDVFRNTPSAERLKYMTENILYYASYMSYEQLRMKTVTEEYLINEIRWHAGENDIPESEINSVIPYVMEAENIEIGGGYSGDHTFISIKDSSIMLVECGIWD